MLPRLVGPALMLVLALHASVIAQDKNNDLQKKIDDALKELDRGKDAPVPQDPPRIERPVPPARKVPQMPQLPPLGGVGGGDFLADLARLNKQLNALQQVIVGLDDLGKPGVNQLESIENLARQFDELNRDLNNGQPSEPIDLMIQQLRILNQLQNNADANPFDLFRKQMDLLQRADGLGGAPPEQPRLGVMLEAPTPLLADQLDLPHNQGLVVERVVENTPAARSGFRTHDVILEMGGQPVTRNMKEFMTRIRTLPAGQGVDFVVLRKGKREAIREVQLAGPRR